jgi:hypothetical protein
MHQSVPQAVSLQASTQMLPPTVVQCTLLCEPSAVHVQFTAILTWTSQCTSFLT